MESANNPYRAPASRVAEQESIAIVPAEHWRRFVNLLIDHIGFLAFCAVFVIVFGVDNAIEKLDGPFLVYLADFVLMFAYYVPLEAIFGRTLGKLVTGTKVVDENGNTPGWGKVCGRTLCRFIPFEAFSFFVSDARGWHDSIPGTYVVKLR